MLKFKNTKIFTDNIEKTALEQVEKLISIEAFKHSKIRIMPDVHAGAGCVIGFTGNLGDKVIPNIVGVDIGCGIYVQPLELKTEINFHAFHQFIIDNIPSGRDVRDKEIAPEYMDTYRNMKELIKSLHIYRELKDVKRLYKSIGTLGGGNHFIEIDKDKNGNHFLTIHTGSRNLGLQVAKLYQNKAIALNVEREKLIAKQQFLVEKYKFAGKKDKQNEAMAKLRIMKKQISTSSELCWLEGKERENYLHDMRLCQVWAKYNRRVIAGYLTNYLEKSGIIECLGDAFESVHNYIGDDNIIRKGAISAYKGEKCIIPMNMRDGSLICIGKGNSDWNKSAPHGAGRIMSRKMAFERLNISDFRKSMNGIYSETVTLDTIDEAPMAYKPKEEIIANISDTVKIVNTIFPIFNFKAAE